MVYVALHVLASISKDSEFQPLSDSVFPEGGSRHRSSRPWFLHPCYMAVTAWTLLATHVQEAETGLHTRRWHSRVGPVKHVWQKCMVVQNNVSPLWILWDWFFAKLHMHTHTHTHKQLYTRNRMKGTFPIYLLRTCEMTRRCVGGVDMGPYLTVVVTY